MGSKFSLKSFSRAQGTIEEPFLLRQKSLQAKLESFAGPAKSVRFCSVGKESIAQGTIEYIVIIAVVIVLSLVVVGLVISSAGSPNDVASTVSKTSQLSGLISISEAIVGTDGNSLISLSNNSGGVLVITKLSIDGSDASYSNVSLSQGDKKTFSLGNIGSSCSCTGFVGSERTCDVIVYNQSDTGLEKQFVTSVSVECVSNAAATNSSSVIQPISYLITLGFKDAFTDANLSGVNMDCEGTVYDRNNQSPPVSITFKGGNTYSCIFSKTGYASTTRSIVANSNQSLPIYLGPPSSVHFSDCNTLNTADGNFILDNNIGSGGACIIVGADNVKIFGNGYKITGDINAGKASGAYIGFKINYATVDGNIMTIGGGEGAGGTVTAMNSTILRITTTGGNGMHGGAGGAITITNSTISTITSIGGWTNGSCGGCAAGGGGAVTATNSTLGTINTTGGRNANGAGAGGGAVTLTNSTATTITTKGETGSSGGAGGIVTLVDSNTTTINTQGSSTTSSVAGAGGAVLITRSNTGDINSSGGTGSVTGGRGGDVNILTPSTYGTLTVIGGNPNGLKGQIYINGVRQLSGIGSFCRVGSDCNSTYCDTNNFVCSNGQTGIDSCAQNTDCNSQYCDLNIRKCAAPLVPGNINTCGGIITSGTFTLTSNISVASGTCLLIQADNVIIAGAGFTIAGDINTNKFGARGYTGLQISNATVNGNLSLRGDSSADVGYAGGSVNITSATISGSINTAGGNSTVRSTSSQGGGAGGAVAITDSVTGAITTLGGTAQGYWSAAGKGGEVTVANSAVGAITASGGTESYSSGAGGTGGAVTLTDSNATTITTIGTLTGCNTPGVGGAVTLTDSNVTTITATGGGGYYNKTGGKGGKVTATDSIIGGTITTNGGIHGYTGIGGTGGDVNIINSVVTSIIALGGAYDNSQSGTGGVGGAVTITDSNITTITASGGEVFANGSEYSAGTGGAVRVTNSNVTTIISTGGSVEASRGGSGGAGGAITVTNSNVANISVYGTSGISYSSTPNRAGGNGGTATITSTSSATLTTILGYGGNSTGTATSGNGAIVSIQAPTISLANSIIRTQRGIPVTGTSGTPGRLTLNYTTSFTDNNSFYDSNSRLIMVNSYGDVNFFQIINSSFTNLASNLILASNSVSLNTTSAPALNVPSRIDFNLVGLGITTPQIKKSGVNCNNPDCNILSYSGEIIAFTVTDWNSSATYTVTQAS